MPVSGGETVARNIKSFGGGFLKHVRVVMGEVTKDLDREVTKNMSLTCHTQKQLTALGHPYAARHGTTASRLHDPIWQVHKQSGNLLRSKDSYVVGPNIIGGRMSVRGSVRLNEMDVPYANAIIWGNGRMIPRDFLSGSINDKTFQRRASSHLTRNLRGLVTSFRGVETK